MVGSDMQSGGRVVLGLAGIQKFSYGDNLVQVC